MKDKQGLIKLTSKLSTYFFSNNFIEMQAINMMLVNHVQSRVCHVTALADAGSHLWSTSNRMLTAVDLTATGVIVYWHFLHITYRTFK